MKTRLINRLREKGNVILVALMISAVGGITLGSYLLMAQHQNVSIYRSQVWNASMVVTEAGVEDGLQLINLFSGSVEPTDLFKWTNSATLAGWDHPSSTTWHVQRFIPAGNVTNSYEVWIYNTNNEPTVYAVGTVPWTYLYAAAPGAQPMFAQIGNTAPAGSSALTRAVQVKTHYDPMFVVAMAASDNIDLHGNRIASDSFDSIDPRYSTNGMYPYGIPGMTKDNGGIATDSAVVDALNAGNANIRGRVMTGPGTNTISLNNGSVGSRAWVDANTRGIEPGYSATDFNVLFPRVRVNASAWVPLLQNPTTVNGVDYRYNVTSPGNYTLSGLNQSIRFNVPSNTIANLYISGDVNLTGHDQIDIAPTGGQVRIYMAGSSFSSSGGGIVNEGNVAQNFYLLGLPTLTSISFNGNNSFTGAIYAPSAAFTLGGGGSDTYDFVGASVTRSVQMNGHYNFHFDENLSRVGPGKGYIPVAWLEK